MCPPMLTAPEQTPPARIARDWRRVREGDRPWGVWIRRYPPLATQVDRLDVRRLPEAVWFLDDGGLRLEDIYRWMRFLHLRPTDDSDAGRRLFAIGRAAFAPYEEEECWYVETLWGPRHGTGSRWRPGSAASPEEWEELWRA